MAVLGLSAGANEIHYQDAGDVERGLMAEILFYERKREVYSGGNTCRSVNRSISQKNRIRFDNDRRDGSNLG
jgi:hypothetical protein